MKAILVIDVSDDKKYANDKWFIEGEEIGIRNMTEKGEFGEYYKEIDDWGKLELKPMPSKYELTTEKGNRYAVGWNDCIDELLEEQE